MRYELTGRIDSGNASEVESAILARLAEDGTGPTVLDAEKLEYISSAGLRVLLRLRKSDPELSVINVNPEVYEIFDMTGFTEMMTVEKAFRRVSVEGCELIGRGAKGKIYRIDRDNVVKVYKDANALEDIKHEREMARLALILGIPTAISYDVVRVGESYGSVFELLNARSFSQILAAEPDKLGWCASEYAKLLKKLHSTEVPEGKLPDMKERMLGLARTAAENLDGESGRKLIALFSEVPACSRMIHGDYHTNNIELMNGEVILIDMDTLAVGDPIFELGLIFSAYVGFSETDPGVIKGFLGIDRELGAEFWKNVLACYLGTDNEAVLRSVEDKARVVGYARLLRHAVHHNTVDSRREEFERWRAELSELLGRVDSLRFLPGGEEFPAEAGKLPEVQEFIGKHLEMAGCSPRTRMQIELAVEEVFVNIACYAYAPGNGTAYVGVDTVSEPGFVTITFRDSGREFDPLQKNDPDITLSADERGIGGLGIFLTKKTMDEVRYERRDGSNTLSIKKKL